MAEPNLDHPGDMLWFVGHGPAPVIGPCPHTCSHSVIANIAWGPDWAHYTLNACIVDDGCDGECRGWCPDGDAPKPHWPTVWHQVDLSRETPTTLTNRRGFAPTDEVVVP